MRLMLELFNSNNVVIPINYQYPVSASIYKILSKASEQYSEFLHQDGYTGMDGKRRKMFTFSKLQFTPKTSRRGKALFVKANSHGSLYISSLFIDDFMKNIIMGITKKNHIEINNARFEIVNITALPEPDLESKNRFLTLSPITLSTITEFNGTRIPYYYRPLDSGLENAVHKSLLGKYETFHQKPLGENGFSFRLDNEYIKKRGGERGVSRLVHIKEGTPQATQIKAIECPFYLDGPLELKRIAWHCGIGDKTSMGFGCIEIGKTSANMEKHYDRI